MQDELLKKLFRYKKEVEYDGVKFWMRIPGDQQVEEARDAALLESRKLRKNLRDSESDDYIVHIDPINDLESEEVYQLCASLATRDVARDYINSNPKPVLDSLGDYPTQEEQENRLAAEIQREIDYSNGMKEYIDTWKKSYLAGLERQGVERARVIYKKLKTDRVCEERFSHLFEDYLLAFAVYADESCTTSSLTRDQMRNAPTKFKDFIKDNFSSMNVSSDDVKK